MIIKIKKPGTILFLIIFFIISNNIIAKNKYSIGKSTLGEPIEVFRFGSGKRKILLIGGMHGDETSAIRLCWKFVYYFKKNFSSIPENITLLIIPLDNPDGYFFHTRLNANGVDLNRNLPTRNWQKKTYAFKTTLPAGGGDFKNSEAETKALINFYNRERPYLTISYHSRAGFIYPEIGDSKGISLARVYAKGSKIKVLLLDWSKTNYKITGSFAQWILKKQGLHTFTVENKYKYKISTKEILANINGLKRLLKYFSTMKKLK